MTSSNPATSQGRENDYAPSPHPTILRRAVLLCSEPPAGAVVQIPADGICPVHRNGACALWYVPWADAKRAAEASL